MRIDQKMGHDAISLATVPAVVLPKDAGGKRCRLRY